MARLVCTWQLAARVLRDAANIPVLASKRRYASHGRSPQNHRLWHVKLPFAATRRSYGRRLSNGPLNSGAVEGTLEVRSFVTVCLPAPSWSRTRRMCICVPISFLHTALMLHKCP
ncbi:hypothetical protein C8T65DRAFT_643857 [Cerioporus squamosus]|nr:hypothetical protein C8T65DRAFT_643857 [Cerioporus squamosus]